MLLDENNHPGGVIGAQHMSDKSIAWQVQDMRRANASFYSDAKKYKIRAYLQYVGRAPFTCEPTSPESSTCTPKYPEALQAKIELAKLLMSESEYFTIK